MHKINSSKIYGAHVLHMKHKPSEKQDTQVMKHTVVSEQQSAWKLKEKSRLSVHRYWAVVFIGQGPGQTILEC